MSVYPLRALATDGKTPFDFTLYDGPCPISRDEFVLQNRPNTPILQYKSILRGTDIPGVCEGDILEEDGVYYSVNYKRGFVAVSPNHDVKELSEFRNINVVSNIYNEREFPILRSWKILYKCENSIYSIFCFYGSDKRGVWANIGKGLYLPYGSLRQYAGIAHESNKLYFGDQVCGGVLTLNQGRCCVNGVDITKLKKQGVE